MNHIETCRTQVLGGHKDTCEHCGYQVRAYNSCGDRHCPKCQALRQAKWVAQRKQRILPTHYFHVVFTLPRQLRSIALCNRTLFFNLLFATCSETLLELGNDEKYIGGQLGITSVLHTWDRKLDFHPHLHCIVTGGGYHKDSDQWISAKKDFIFPVRVLSKLFQGKFLDALSKAYRDGSLQFAGKCMKYKDPQTLQSLFDKLYRKKWVVYAKPPFGGPQAVFEYLGRYTHRVAISNQRLLAYNSQKVTFLTKNGKTASLKHTEFIRRFLMHILPKGYTKIRHFGLLAACNVNSKLMRAKDILNRDQSCAEQPDRHPDTEPVPDNNFREQMLALTGTDLFICPRCRVGKMFRTPIPKEIATPIAFSTPDTS